MPTTHLALLTSFFRQSESRQPEAVQSEGQAEQQRLAGLCVRGSAGRRQESLRFTAEKALSIKERFPYCSLFCWEVVAHLQARTACPAASA
jgi:hypothetical protein